MPDRPIESLTVRGGRWVLTWNGAPGVDAGLAGRVVLSAGGPPLPAATASARVRQVHGAEVREVNDAGVHGDADALVTTRVGLPLAVRVADCVPIFLVTPRGVGLAHAGWRGTASGIASRTLHRLLAVTGDAPAEALAWIGPAIGACCYEIGDEVAREFSDRHLRTAGGRSRLDLAAVNRNELEAAGVPGPAIAMTAFCTRCHQHLFHSHRGSAGKPGRLDAFLVRQE